MESVYLVSLIISPKFMSELFLKKEFLFWEKSLFEWNTEDLGKRLNRSRVASETELNCCCRCCIVLMNGQLGVGGVIKTFLGLNFNFHIKVGGEGTPEPH